MKPEWRNIIEIWILAILMFAIGVYVGMSISGNVNFTARVIHEENQDDH